MRVDAFIARLEPYRAVLDELDGGLVRRGLPMRLARIAP